MSNTECRFSDRYQIETPEGFKDFSGIGKIKEKQSLVRILLEDDNYIDVNLGHIFIVDGIDINVKDLVVGECLETKFGYKKIKDISILEFYDYVFDILEVESSDNSYYANDIKNHNCKFLGSSDTLVDNDILERTTFQDPVSTKWSGLLKIYERPISGVKYILGIDASKGTGRDYSVIQVLKLLDQYNVKQVAVFRYNKVDTLDFAQYCISVSKYYNHSEMMIENNGEGAEVANFIWYEYEYDKIVNCDKKGLGIRSTRKSKLSANLLLKRYLENKWLELVDKDTIEELSKYIEVKPNVFQAETRMTHDDCVTSLLWGLYFIESGHYEEKDEDTKEIDEKFVIEEETPIIFVS
ncbi:MAG: hypothetical protein ACOCZ5_00165 [bacterium]